jgi:pyruvate dehydrogenase E2 component (dihydrolipoamide acetyltransferase)
VNEVIAVVGPAGTDLTPYLNAFKSAPEGVKPAPVENAKMPEAPIPAATIQTTQDDGRIKASPLAKQIARDKGIDLRKVQGSGDYGRIVKRDLDNYKEMPQESVTQVAGSSMMSAQLQSGTEGYTDYPVTQMRKIIAQRLGESKFSAPHFYLRISVEMDNMMQARKEINQVSSVKVSFNDIMIKAVALALRKHPEVNSSWLGDVIRQNHHIHIGSAIALEEGLIVPVIRFADQKSLAQIAADANDLYEKARNKKIQPQEFSGNTFTISNLGMMDIDDFTAIINPPDACILAVGRIAPTPVVVDQQIQIKHIMRLTLSCDHRIVDGAVGARFLQTLKTYLQQPYTMLA